MTCEVTGKTEITGRVGTGTAQRSRDIKQVIIYTDGACSGNPGPAGIGAILMYGRQKKEIAEFIGNATNNIAELEAVRAALLALKRRDLPVRLYTDSDYVQGILKKNWRAKKNTELVKQIQGIVKEFSDLKILRVPGHKGVKANERADGLAASALKNQNKKTA